MADSFLKIMDLALETVIFNKFKDLLSVTSQDNDIAFMPKDVAFRHISEKRGKVEVEFMNLWRSGVGMDWNRNRSVLATRGIEIASATPGASGLLKTVPAKLNYDFWVWSKDKDILNAVSERYMFWPFNNPNVDISLNGTIPLEFDMHFGDIEDDRTQELMFEHGTYYVHRYPITLDGWVFDLNSSNKIILTIYLKGYDDSVDSDGVLLWSAVITSLDEEDDVWEQS